MAKAAVVAKRSNRGSKPGERRGGREKGTPNKATASIKDAAREYTTKALETFIACIDSPEAPWPAKVAAASHILDRGYGKPSTVLSGDEDGGPISLATTIELIGVRPGEG